MTPSRDWNDPDVARRAQRNAATRAGYRRELVDGGDFPVTAERLLAMLRAAGSDAACLDIRADRALLLR